MKTILLAEHHAPTREHLVGVLSLAGYRVQAPTDAAGAVELFRSMPPALAIVAVEFPRLDGSHLGKLLRETEVGARVPLVMIDHGHLGKARGVTSVLDLKANAYLPDPLKGNGNVLLERVAALIAAEPAAAASTRGTATTLARTPTITGELKARPLIQFLHDAYRSQREGILVVAHRELTRRVYFVRGRAVHYDSTARQDGFPPHLVSLGKLTEDEETKVQAALAGGLRIGAALVDSGAALGESGSEELLQLLRDYTREKVAQVVAMHEGRYAFYPGDEFLLGLATVELPALSPLLDGARRALALRDFARPLLPHLDAYPSRAPSFSHDLPALGLDRADLKIAMQVNGRTSLRDLVAHGRGELRDAYSLFWFLSLTGTIAFASSPPASEKPDRIAPRRRKPLPPDVAQSLREGVLNVIAGSYFKVLGLPITADDVAVENAYREIASRYHPDAYAEYDVAELQDLLDSVQERLTAAYRVLGSETKRKAYLSYLLSRLDAGRATDINIDAELSLKHGEAALKRRDIARALVSFERAVELNPREPEYYTYLAWATFQGGKGSREERAKAALKVLKKALALNPYLERAAVIQAVVESALGDHPQARKRLLKVLEQNPSSQLAKAALRKVGRT